MNPSSVRIATWEWGYVQRLAGRDFARGDQPFTVDRYFKYEAFAAAWERQAPATREALANPDYSILVFERTALD